MLPTTLQEKLKIIFPLLAKHVVIKSIPSKDVDTLLALPGATHKKKEDPHFDGWRVTLPVDNDLSMKLDGDYKHIWCSVGEATLLFSTKNTLVVSPHDDQSEFAQEVLAAANDAVNDLYLNRLLSM